MNNTPLLALYQSLCVCEKSNLNGLCKWNIYYYSRKEKAFLVRSYLTMNSKGHIRLQIGEQILTFTGYFEYCCRKVQNLKEP